MIIITTNDDTRQKSKSWSHISPKQFTKDIMVKLLYNYISIQYRIQ